MVFNPKGVGDVNGDGYEDYIASFYLGDSLMAGFHYQIYSTKLYYVSSTFDTIPDLTINNSICYPLGDINNDGYDDIMALELNCAAVIPYTICCIYPGGTEINETQKFICELPFYFNMKFSIQVEEIGDLNGDGYKDFIIASPYNWTDGLGRVFIYHGGKTIKEEPDQILQVKLKQMGTSSFGSSVIGIGDNNKDGYNDILIAETVLSGDSGNLQLYYGGDKLDSIPNKIFLPEEIDFGRQLKNAGDLNNDNVVDFIVTTSGSGNCYINLGIDSIIHINMFKWGYGGYIGVGAGGDINGDGYDDFILSNTNYKDSLGVMTGAIWGFWGNKEIDTIPDYQIIGNKKWFRFGESMDIAGDINDDGYDDVLILEPNYPDYNKPWGKVYIYSYKNLTYVDGYTEINDFYLSQNYPNPFNPTTIIKYALPADSNVELKIYDLMGREVRTMVNGYNGIGYKEIMWDGKNEAGTQVSSGIYLYRLIARSLEDGKIFEKSAKMIMMK
jgi:hypothetical protein